MNYALYSLLCINIVISPRCDPGKFRIISVHEYVHIDYSEFRSRKIHFLYIHEYFMYANTQGYFSVSPNFSVTCYASHYASRDTKLWRAILRHIPQYGYELFPSDDTPFNPYGCKWPRSLACLTECHQRRHRNYILNPEHVLSRHFYPLWYLYILVLTIILRVQCTSTTLDEKGKTDERIAMQTWASYRAGYPISLS